MARLIGVVLVLYDVGHRSVEIYGQTTQMYQMLRNLSGESSTV